MNIRRELPLCVDLDGTLIFKDTNLDCMILLLEKNPLYIFAMLWWILQGRAKFKEQVAKRVLSDIDKLPYNPVMIDMIREARNCGQTVCLVTATDVRIASAIQDHLKLFDQVFASNGFINLRAERKAQCLVQEFGAGGYIYAGNSRDDLHVWKYAAQAIVVKSTPGLAQKAKKLCDQVLWINSKTSEIQEVLE